MRSTTFVRDGEREAKENAFNTLFTAERCFYPRASCQRTNSIASVAL